MRRSQASGQPERRRANFSRRAEFHKAHTLGTRGARPSGAWLLLLVGCCLSLLRAGAEEMLPPAPQHYFNDYAHVTSAATAQRLNQELENFEKQTSDQLLVVIYPRMESPSALEDYTVRVARAWRVGQKARDNGAILFVFVQDHRLRLEVGYGLEGALPDATANRIIEDEIEPHFRRGDFDGGVTAGVTAMMQAVRGEYRGTGRTAAQEKHGSSLPFWIVGGFVVAIILLSLRRTAARGTVYQRAGRTTYWGSPVGWHGGGWGGGGGWSGGGGGSGGGGFSGGGGSFGGGGASGSW
jgi:uncharacterized protein